MHYKFFGISLLVLLIAQVGCSPTANQSITQPIATFDALSSTSTLTLTPSQASTATPTIPSVTSTAPSFQLPENGNSGWLEHGMEDLPRAVFSPDGSILATGHRTGRVVLWDMTTGHMLRTLDSPPTGASTEITALDFSPNGTLIAAAKPYQGRVVVWNTMTGELVQSLESLEGDYNLTDVKFSPDGVLLGGGISVGPDPDGLGKIILWNTETWTIQVILDNVGPHLVFGHDGKMLATSSQASLLDSGPDNLVSGSFVFWEVSTGQQLQTMTPGGLIAGFDYSSEKQILAANLLQNQASQPGYVSLTQIIDATTGEILHSLSVPTEGASITGLDTLTFNSDASLLAVGYQPNRIVLWDVSTGSLLYTLDGSAQWLRYPVFSSDGSLLAASSLDGRILFWKVNP